MGVPSFFRWLTSNQKCPKVLVYCAEERPQQVGSEKVPIDTSKPNPNGLEFDNLYLDMNGIIHPCTHPEDRPAPKNEDEMFRAIFDYIDRIFSIVRPRRLLYMAIDGVAPRAKMNQQRSRRFRASKDGSDRTAAIERVRADLAARGIPVPEKKSSEDYFDSNCITPGTPFMQRLAERLRYYVHDRLNFDPGWKSIMVVLSDANVPGEGEHKIMDYIRRQRASPSHDPNTHHCLCGADADLIMLGLATHEPNFTIVREEFIPYHEKPCELCGQFGHELKDCVGLAREPGANDEPLYRSKNFIFLRLNVLREYLARELYMENLPFGPFDFERAIDDWVFMCFFVGNDFLPHLPSLEIRENAIDRLVQLYKKSLYKTGGWITDSGFVNLERVQLILSDLGAMEDEIFEVRHTKEQLYQDRQKQDRKRRLARADTSPATLFVPEHRMATTAVGHGNRPPAARDIRQTAHEMRVEAMGKERNNEAAQKLKAMLRPSSSSTEIEIIPSEKPSSEAREPLEQKGVKRKHEEEEEEPLDDVRLWEEGWKERYYQAKFGVTADNLDFRYRLAHAYVEGLCWVLRYYYQGVPSWKWFFPYHYAPFASDFVHLSELKIDFDSETKPFKPLEQLMGVFPAASGRHIPEIFSELMKNENSPIIDFYPTEFKVDLNGKKFAWQGVALLPFVDERRLLKVMRRFYSKLSREEQALNAKGYDLLLVGGESPLCSFLKHGYEDKAKRKQFVPIDTALSNGVAGRVQAYKFVCMPGKVYKSPFEGSDLRDIYNNSAICVNFSDPQFDKGYKFEAKRLEGAKEPETVLQPASSGSYYRNNDRNYFRGAGFERGQPRAGLAQAGHRMIHHSMSEYGGPPPLGAMQPPQGGGYNPFAGWGPRGSPGNRGGGGNRGGPFALPPAERWDSRARVDPHYQYTSAQQMAWQQQQQQYGYGDRNQQQQYGYGDGRQQQYGNNSGYAQQRGRDSYQRR